MTEAESRNRFNLETKYGLMAKTFAYNIHQRSSPRNVSDHSPSSKPLDTGPIGSHCRRHGRSTPFSTVHCFYLTEKPWNTERTSHDHPQMLLTPKKSTKLKQLSMQNSTNASRKENNYDTLLNGRATPTQKTNGSPFKTSFIPTTLSTNIT